MKKILKGYIKALILEKISDDPMFANQQQQQVQPQPQQPQNPEPDTERRRKSRDIKMRRRPERGDGGVEKKRSFEMPKLSDNPKVKDAQEHIYVMKRRIGDLDVISYLAKFKKSYDDFNNRITKYDTDRHEIRKYLVLLKSNATALTGILESISTECEELENKLKD